MFLSLPSPAAQHLLEQDARFDRSQEDQILQIWDVDPSRQEVDGYDNRWVGSIAKLANALQRSVGSASDLASEGLTTAEHLASLLDQLVGMRRVRQIVDRKDQRLREAPELCLMCLAVPLDLFEDLAIRVGRSDFSLDLGGVVSPLVL